MKRIIFIFFISFCFYGCYSQCNNLIVGKGCVVTNQSLKGWLNFSTNYVDGYQWLHNDSLLLDGKLIYTYGSPDSGDVLTSDSRGVASWQPSGGGGGGNINGNLTPKYLPYAIQSDSLVDSKFYQQGRNISLAWPNYVTGSDTVGASLTMQYAGASGNAILSSSKNTFSEGFIGVSPLGSVMGYKNTGNFSEVTVLPGFDRIKADSIILVARDDYFQIDISSKGDGKILTSNSNGVSTWQSSASLLLPKILNVNNTNTGNITTGEDNLMSYTLPANSLNNSDYLEIGGTFSVGTSSFGSKNIKLYFGSQTEINISLAPSVDYYVDINAKIYRTGSNSQKVVVTSTKRDLTSEVVSTELEYESDTQSLTSNVIIKFTGESDVTDDIIQRVMYVKYNPFN